MTKPKPKNELKAYRGKHSYLTEEQIRILSKNPNIVEVTPRQVHYTQTFKNYFCREYAKGRSSTEILREQGIDPKVLGETRISSLRTYYNSVKRAFPGRESLAHEGKNPYRGTKGSGHTQLQTNADIMHMIGKLEQQVQYLQKEADFLKKNFRTQRARGRLPCDLEKDQKFAIIEEILDLAKRTHTNCPNLVWLCNTAGVSRSGYYKWLKTKEARIKREQQDQADFNLILTAYKLHGYTKGARGIQMALLHLDEPVIMNLKKIRRLMKKYGLTCPIRKPNPYRIALRESMLESIPPNILDRRFREFGPRRVLLTDITYIPMNNGQFCYLSTITDAYAKEILSYQLSQSLKEQFVLDTFRRLVLVHGKELTNETIVHSDQGVHYRAKKFNDLMEDANLIRSMSRRATCWDNAPQESFYGHMKDEIGSKIAKSKTFPQISKVIINYMNYYNHHRYQWDLAKLAPAEYYEYSMTGIYPLPKGDDKNQDKD